MLNSSFRSLKTIALSAALVLSAAAANAVTVTVDAYDNGWYRSTGVHSTTNTNIIASGSYNNWFAFDLSSVTGLVTGATLTIFGDNGKYANAPSTATYRLFDVSTDVDVLTAGTGGVAAHTDLESGTQYGATNVATPGSEGRMPQVTVAMTGGLNDINASLGGKFAVGGTTDATTFLWGYSNYSNFTAAKLTLTTQMTVVPVPASIALMGAGLLGLGLVARRRTA